MAHFSGTPKSHSRHPDGVLFATGTRWLLAFVLPGIVVAAILVWRWDFSADRRAEALYLAKEGRLAEAEPLLLKAVARNGNDVEVVAALAVAKLGGTDPGSAEEYLSKWCELRPTDSRPFQLRMDLRHRVARGLAVQADRLRVMETALADGRRVLELTPGNEPVRREVAWLAFQVGHYSEAEAECRQCLSVVSFDGWLSYLLARICHAQGKRTEAEAAIDPVVQAQPNFADALILRAVLYSEAEQHDRAIPLLRRALELKGCPRRECLYRLGLALAATGQTDEARKVMAEVDLLNLKGAVENDHFPNNPAMRVQIAEAMLGVGRVAEAIAELDTILAEAPSFAPAHRAKAAYYKRVGKPELAAEHLRRAGQDAP